MAPEKSKVTKNDTPATSMIKAARQLEQDTPVDMSSGSDSVDLIQTISNSIMGKTAMAAKNTADTMALDSEIELTKKRKELTDLKSPTAQPTGGFGLSGLGGGRSALVQTILAAVPENERAAFIRENRDMLLGSEPANGLLGLLNKPQQHTGGVSPTMEAAALITAMGAEQREQALFQQRMLQQQTPPPVPAPAQPVGVVSQMELINLIKENNAANLAMMDKVTTQMTNIINGVQERFQSLTDKHREETMDMRKELLATQREAFEADKAHLTAKLEEIAASRSNVQPLSLNDIPLLKQALGNAGMQVSTVGAAQQETTRKWDIENRKLDMAADERQRQYDMQLEDKRIELEKSKARTATISTIAQLAGQALNTARVNKAINKSSDNAASVGGRFNE